MSTYETNRYAFPASAIASGTFADARIPDLATSKITSGTFADARLSSSSVTQHVDLSNLNASNLTSGSIPNARVPSGAVTQHVSAVTNTSGTWSPSLYTSGQNFGAYTVSSSARYVRVGDLVFCSAVFRTNNGNGTGGNSTDQAYMGGLPFTSANVSTPGQGFMRYRRGNMKILVSQNSTTATLVYGSSQGGTPYSTSGDGTKRLHINDGWTSTRNYFSCGFLYRV